MTAPDPRRRDASPMAAGAPLALATVAGALIGSLLHQPSLGLVVGIGAGAAIAVGWWLVDRRRAGR